MKYSKKIISLTITIAIVFNIFMLSDIKAMAHEAMLDVEYDNCITHESNQVPEDGIDEMWYGLEFENVCRHISHNETTIKYYFSDLSYDGTYSWPADNVGQEIKDAYANSMKKWNNVYFYSYDSDGLLQKHKVINIIEGTESDHNLTIYPTHNSSNYATTDPIGYAEIVETGTTGHFHYSEWYMQVNINYFDVNSTIGLEAVRVARERIGAHEIGHILGLRDIDSNSLCQSNVNFEHHTEIIMGYGTDPTSRALDITYKDIAGVAIMRGFHTDNDHKWLNCGLQSDGTYKILCSICNGVRYVNSLSEYTYDTYNACNGNHNLSSGIIVLVDADVEAYINGTLEINVPNN